MASNIKCPKCGFEQEKSFSCMKCGVIYSKYLRMVEQEKEAAEEKAAIEQVVAEEEKLKKIAIDMEKLEKAVAEDISSAGLQNKNHPPSKDSDKPLWICLGVLMVILVGLTIFNGLPDFFAPEITVDSKTIYKEFSNNEVAAVARYKGKKVAVTGVYVGNGVSLNQPWIIIGDGVLLADVQCFLNEDSIEKAGALRMREMVKVQGVVTGKIGSVMLDDCSL